MAGVPEPALRQEEVLGSRICTTYWWLPGCATMPAWCLRMVKIQRWTILGDPTEAALRVAAQKGGVDLEAEARRTPRVRELPFDSRRKRMSTIHKDRDSQMVYVKGAPKEVLALCTHVRQDGQVLPMDDSLGTRIMAANDDYARNGLRVLAVAYRQLA